jgi:methionyl-tRNA formyltransferase
MKISIVCSNPAHPVNRYLQQWIEAHGQSHEIDLVRCKRELVGGDLLLLVSCGEIVTASDRAAYKKSLVLHASDLPKGRGWSPHIWEIASGAQHITLTLLDAQDKVDSGKIWKKIQIPIPQTALWDEINHVLFRAEMELMDFAIDAFDAIEPAEQATDVDSTYFRLRTPDDSRINPEVSIADQFDLIRVCDPVRFPAFFEHRGQKYVLKLERPDE